MKIFLIAYDLHKREGNDRSYIAKRDAVESFIKSTFPSSLSTDVLQSTWFVASSDTPTTQTIMSDMTKYLQQEAAHRQQNTVLSKADKVLIIELFDSTAQPAMSAALEESDKGKALLAYIQIYNKQR